MWTFVSSAWAGACCSGSMSAIPAEVPQCEDALAAVTLGGETALARWDGAGQVTGASPSEENATASVLGAARLVRWGQLGVVVPAVGSARSAGDLSDAGFGLGDVRVGARLDPVEEGDRAVPVLRLGVRLPTGRDWTEAEGPLLADVTGRPGVGATAGLALQRSLGEVPWWIGLDAAADPDLPVALAASAGLGRSFGPDWTLVGSLAYSRALAVDGASATTLSGRLIRGEVRRLRAGVGVSGDVPAPLLGRDGPAAVGLDLGLAAAR